MQVDLIGRVNNTVLLSQTESLTYSKTLFPLFKDTGNSIYIIKDVDISNRYIDIYAEIDDFQSEFKVVTQDIRPINKFGHRNITSKISECAKYAKLVIYPDNRGYFEHNESLKE